MCVCETVMCEGFYGINDVGSVLDRVDARAVTAMCLESVCRNKSWSQNK